jgi:hypothetical protein
MISPARRHIGLADDQSRPWRTGTPPPLRGVRRHSSRTIPA